MKRTFALAWLGTFLVLGGTIAWAADTNTPPAKPNTPPAKTKAAEPGKGKARANAIRGELKAVDDAAKTFTVGEKVYTVTSQTKIKRAGKPAILGDLKAGDTVVGTSRDTNGKLEAVTVTATEPKATTPEKKK
jgi:hypothetical protein